ncbi:hypothetical protein BW730_11905 [Tessaracoccus aquimaris]|uniref:HTH gntR-type domain-containing protein n=1 Tax=Tessaracoccus aquimaris TaxID=1332264 RepID=A0A1Q2CPN0_9ACTN|nr:FCD domain-containing protein [Tessaracoccus aquimaris]AQP48087.1 hypothetical protein BW730_11905 [Tessaracoccus aquimaris]
MSDKLAPDGLVMRLAAHLRVRAARDGDLLPSEAKLMADLGVGRQQLREALRVLEAFGAVDSRQGARRRWRGVNLGGLVASFAQLTGSPQETTAELLGVRQALETSMLAKVMPMHTPASLVALRDLALGMEERAARGVSFIDLDEEFHLTLFAPLRNSTLEGILGAFWTLLSVVEGPTQQGVADPDVAAMHTAIIDAMQAGDFNLARYELDTHFYGVRLRVLPSRLDLKSRRTTKQSLRHLTHS